MVAGSIPIQHKHFFVFRCYHITKKYINKYIVYTHIYLMYVLLWANNSLNGSMDFYKWGVAEFVLTGKWRFKTAATAIRLNKIRSCKTQKWGSLNSWPLKWRRKWQYFFRFFNNIFFYLNKISCYILLKFYLRWTKSAPLLYSSPYVTNYGHNLHARV